MTLPLISKDFIDNTEFREPLYKLVETLSKKFLKEIILKTSNAEEIILTVLYGIKHLDRTISELVNSEIKIEFRSIRNHNNANKHES